MNNAAQPPRIHIVGRRNSGKTTLVCELLSYWNHQGRRVASVKHTHHRHELDTPGKDSHRHREAGAAAVGILTPQMTAVFTPVIRTDDESQRYAELTRVFSDCDLILVEGDIRTAAMKVEVWRPECGQPPWCVSTDGISALVTAEADEAASHGRLPDVWQRSDLAEIADGILRQVSSAERR